MDVSFDGKNYTVQLDGGVMAQFAIPSLGNGAPTDVTWRECEEGWRHCLMTWEVSESIQQDELAVQFDVLIEPDLWWTPHLSPRPNDCIAQHVFRSPALIAAQGEQTLVIVPDLALCGAREDNPWFIDLDAPQKKLWLGMTQSRVYEHVLYEKVPGGTFEPGKVDLGFFILAYRDENSPRNPWRRVSQFLWDRYGHPRFVTGEPGTVPMDAYVKHTYHWAFSTWKDAVWQEFELGGRKVGSTAFIVNTTQSPNYPGEPNLREFLSVWNQAWFSSLRGASGVMRFARRTGDATLREKANLSKEFALAAPMNDGIFPSVYRTEMERVTVEGKQYHRSKGWTTGYWTNSNRTPFERGITDRWYHVLDASWTCLLMLRWYEELEADDRLLNYALSYANKLLAIQDEDGFFPAWLHPETLTPSDILRDSPETSMSVTFLLKLAKITGEDRFRKAAVNAMEAVLRDVVPSGRWEDFETYWSCSQWGKNDYLGERIPRNALHKQCNFSMFWTAEALLETYRATRDRRYLGWGRRTLDELSMTQQVWQPPYIHVPALGGFGVMNGDGEWNDSRQCLFAELFLEYYTETGDPNLFERGVAALKSAFVMMYCPENPKAKVLWEKVWPFFGPADYGFTMENYGHGGVTSREGEGIGEFTIFTWGNGAASEARNRVYDHFGDVYVDRARNQAFGIDSVAVELVDDAITLIDVADSPREIKVVFDDGTSRMLVLTGRAEVPLNSR